MSKLICEVLKEIFLSSLESSFSFKSFFAQIQVVITKTEFDPK